MSSREHVRDVYDTVAADYAALLPDTSFEAPEDLAVLERFLELPLRGASVLDAGCGAGRMLGVIRKRRPDAIVAGIDLAPRMVEHARRSFPFADLAVGDLSNLPLAGASVGGILAWYSVIHSPFDELDEIVAEFGRVCVDHAPVLVAFQSGRGMRRIERAYGHDVSVDAHLHDPREVAAIFSRRGFSVLEWFERPAREGERHPQGFVLARRAVSRRGPTAAAGD